MISLDLLRQHPDVAMRDAELIVAGTILDVMRTPLVVAE